MSLLLTQLENVLVSPNLGKALFQSGAERGQWRPFLAHRAAQDGTHLFLGAAAMPTGAPLKLYLNVVIQIANQDLSHEDLHN